MSGRVSGLRREGSWPSVENVCHRENAAYTVSTERKPLTKTVEAGKVGTTQKIMVH